MNIAATSNVYLLTAVILSKFDPSKLVFCLTVQVTFSRRLSLKVSGLFTNFIEQVDSSLVVNPHENRLTQFTRLLVRWTDLIPVLGGKFSKLVKSSLSCVINSALILEKSSYPPTSLSSTSKD
jgi:hypothetical protein